MVEYRNYRKCGSRKKWTEVVLFEHIPRESPRTSKDCVELARFTHAGDAYIYASAQVQAFNDPCNSYSGAWAVVVR